MSWRIVFSRHAQKGAKKLKEAGLKPKAEKLLELLRENPFTTPLPFEKLVGDLKGAYSRRITFQHRLIYEVKEEERIVKVLRMWTHYE